MAAAFYFLVPDVVVALTLAFVVLLVFTPAIFIVAMRVFLTGRLSAVYQLSAVASVIKKAPGGFVFVASMPLVATSVVYVILSIILSMMAGIAFLAFPFAGVLINGGDGFVTGIYILIVVVVALSILTTILMIFAIVVIFAISYRALGYWVAENAPEWAESSQQ
jgi:hypothetical protein